MSDARRAPRGPAGSTVSSALRSAAGSASVIVLLALAASGCGGARQAKDSADAPRPSAADASDPVHGTVSKPGSDGSAAVPANDTPIPVAAGDKEVPTATVREIVDSADRLGQEVRVTGRCLGYSATGGGGVPPVTRSDWLLGAEGATIYVSGELPPGCSATTASEVPVTILAIVAQDTLPGIGDGPAKTRRYLLRVAR